jgi:hypothetical protein
MGSGVARTVAGSYVGTGAALEIKLDKVGFEPKRVTIYRKTTAIDMAVHVKGMDADSMYLTAAAGGRTLVTSQAITLNSTGFSLGTNAGVNNATDTYEYLCEE